ncbi:MAG: molybdopterin-binding protein, partial [Phycisphaerales bacterium]
MSLDRPIRVAVLTASDRCSRGEAVDASGPAVAALLQHSIAAEIVARRCVPDDLEALVQAFRAWTRPDAAIAL